MLQVGKVVLDFKVSTWKKLGSPNKLISKINYPIITCSSSNWMKITKHFLFKECIYLLNKFTYLTNSYLQEPSLLWHTYEEVGKSSGSGCCLGFCWKKNKQLKNKFQKLPIQSYKILQYNDTSSFNFRLIMLLSFFHHGLLLITQPKRTCENISQAFCIRSPTQYCYTMKFQ